MIISVISLTLNDYASDLLSQHDHNCILCELYLITADDLNASGCLQQRIICHFLAHQTKLSQIPPNYMRLFHIKGAAMRKCVALIRHCQRGTLH